MGKFQKYALAVSLLLLMLPLLAATPAFAGKLTLYTSMKESLAGALRDAFLKAHPEVEFDYYIAGAGRLMAKLASERAAGNVVADVLWHSEIPDFLYLKGEGLLEPYVSPEAGHVESLVNDPDHCFTAVRNGTMGIVYNTDKIKSPPKAWHDLLGPEYKDAFGIADPRLSGTAFGSVAALVHAFGWEFFEACRDNGAVASQGSGQVVEDTAGGELTACIGVDYITADMIKRGAPLGFVFPEEVIMLPSPIAIMKGTNSLEDAKKFVDFLLSREAQAIIAGSGAMPVRADIPLPPDTLLPNPHEAVQRAIRIDFEALAAGKDEIIRRFTELLVR